MRIKWVVEINYQQTLRRIVAQSTKRISLFRLCKSDALNETIRAQIILSIRLTTFVLNLFILTLIKKVNYFRLR